VVSYSEKKKILSYSFVTVYYLNFMIFLCVTLKLFSLVIFVPLLAPNPGDATEWCGMYACYSAMMHYPSDARWSTTRPAVMYVAKADGSLDVWDFLFRCRRPTLNIMVSTPTQYSSISLVTY